MYVLILRRYLKTSNIIYSINHIYDEDNNYLPNYYFYSLSRNCFSIVFINIILNTAIR